MFKLKNNNGRVNSLLRSGNDFVANELSVTSAQHIIDTGRLVESTVDGYPISVDDKWFFEGEEIIEDAKTPARGRKKS